MPGLVDIIALRETVDIRGTLISVRGLSITTIGRCLAESDELQRFWAQRKFDAVALMGSLPRTIARVVATAIIDDPPGHVADGFEGFQPIDGIPPALRQSAEDRERAIAMNMVAFDELCADDQLSLVEAVIRVSFPGGISPFVDRVRLLGGFPPKAPGAEGLIDRLARFGRERAGNSPQPSTN